MYNAIRRTIDCPLEYAAQHMRREIIMFVISHVDFFVTHLAEQLSGLYGVQEEGIPGPFSIKSYLQYLNKPGAWGDSIVLWILSLMWGVGVTVVHGESLDRTKLRHSNSLRETDMVLVHTGSCHYIPGGN
jgi:hypothetical protein